MSEVVQSIQPTGFFKLPQEIRDEIMSLVFGVPSWFPPSSITIYINCLEEPLWLDRVAFGPLDPSQNIQEYAWNWLLPRVQVALGWGEVEYGTDSTWDPDRYLEPLRRLKPDIAKFIKVLAMDFPVLRDMVKAGYMNGQWFLGARDPARDREHIPEAPCTPRSLTIDASLESGLKVSRLNLQLDKLNLLSDVIFDSANELDHSLWNIGCHELEDRGEATVMALKVRNDFINEISDWWLMCREFGSQGSVVVCSLDIRTTPYEKALKNELYDIMRDQFGEGAELVQVRWNQPVAHPKIWCGSEHFDDYMWKPFSPWPNYTLPLLYDQHYFVSQYNNVILEIDLRKCPFKEVSRREPEI